MKITAFRWGGGTQQKYTCRLLAQARITRISKRKGGGLIRGKVAPRGVGPPPGYGPVAAVLWMRVRVYVKSMTVCMYVCMYVSGP